MRVWVDASRGVAGQDQELLRLSAREVALLDAFAYRESMPGEMVDVTDSGKDPSKEREYVTSMVVPGEGWPGLKSLLE